MLEKHIKQNLKEARENGWWIACFYWERKLDKYFAKAYKTWKVSEEEIKCYVKERLNKKLK